MLRTIFEKWYEYEHLYKHLSVGEIKSRQPSVKGIHGFTYVHSRAGHVLVLTWVRVPAVNHTSK